MAATTDGGARSVASDFLHSMRFQVKADDSNFTLGSAEAGFMSSTTPEATVEAVEYREGTYNFPRKFPGNTTVSDVTLNRGVALKDTAFWSWLSIVISGEGEYRSNISILHFDRRVLAGNMPNFLATATAASAARTYVLKEAFPIRHKVAADLDATSSDVSVQELDIAFEWFEVKETEMTVTKKGNVEKKADDGQGNAGTNPPAST